MIFGVFLVPKPTPKQPNIVVATDNGGYCDDVHFPVPESGSNSSEVPDGDGYCDDVQFNDAEESTSPTKDEKAATTKPTKHDDDENDESDDEEEDEEFDQYNRNWNAEFQSILTMEDSFAKWDQLSSLSRDFVYAAKVRYLLPQIYRFHSLSI